MEKAKTKNGALKWILIAVGALVVAAAVVAGILLLKPAKGNVQLYWNVDGNQYRQKDIARPRDKKAGCYHVLFASGGKQVKLDVEDQELVRQIDARDLMGLEVNNDGVVTAVYPVEECSGGYAANGLYVKSVDGNKITANTAPNYDGIEVMLELTDETEIYKATDDGGPLSGMSCKIALEDEIIAVKDYDGNIKTVYTKAYEQPASLYWNITRKWNSTSGTTTRETDALGRYVFQLAYRGEQVEIIAADYDVAKAMDEIAARCFALDLDEEGRAIKVTPARTATHGKSFGSWFHVTALNGNYVEVTRILDGSNKGTVQDAPKAPNIEVYDVSGQETPVGTATELRVGDLVHGVTDSRGRVCALFVIERLTNGYQVCWNVERKYDSTTKLSTRTPDAEGWYRVLVSVDGEQKTVKTKDKEIIQKIDAAAGKHFALLLEGDEIKKYAAAKTVYGGGVFGSWTDVENLTENGTITSVKHETGHKDDGKSFVAKMAENCKVYNVSDTAKVVGEPTTVQMGDRITGLLNLKGELELVYVVTRFEDLPVGFSITRMWDSTRKVSTRKVSADGYYHFDIAIGGKVLDLKTKDPAIVKTIDEQAAHCVGIRYQGDVITRVVKGSSTLATKTGSKSVSWVQVRKVTGNTFTARKEDTKASDYGKTYTCTMAPGCKVVNVSGVYDDHPGEYTNVRVNDTVHALHNKDGQATYVFVITRKLDDVDLYFNRYRKYDTANSVTTRTPDAEGYYVFEMAHGGGIVKLKTQNKDFANTIDSAAGKTVALRVDGDIITGAYSYNCASVIAGGLGCSWAQITSLNGNSMVCLKTDKQPNVTYNLKIAPNCKVYDVYNSATYGKVTDLKVGQTIQCFKDANQQVNYIYVVGYSKPVNPPKPTYHTCTEITGQTQWYEWSSTGDISASGCYVLTEDMVLTDTVRIEKNMDVTICLNGHTVTSAERLFSVYGNLTICDHCNGGNYAGKLIHSGTAFGGIAYLYNASGVNSVMNILGGNLICTSQERVVQSQDSTGKTTVVNRSGELLYVGNTRAAGMTQDATGGVATVNLIDGVLTAENTDTATSRGGLICATNDSVVNIFGGKVCGGRSDFSGVGGNISAMSSTVNIIGGTVEGGKTAYYGGNCYVGGGGTLVLADGTITGGDASRGGNVYIAGGGMFGQLGGTVENGYARSYTNPDGTKRDGNGGNVSAYGSSLTEKGVAGYWLAGGVIRNGYAENITGNLYNFNASGLISDTTIYGGSAVNAMDCYDAFFNKSEVILEGGTINGNARIYNNSSHIGLCGTPKIKKLTIGDNVANPIELSVQLEPDGPVYHLEEGAAIDIKVDSKAPDTELTRVLFSGMSDADLAYITASAYTAAEYQLEVDGAGYGRLAFHPTHVHCLCGNQAEGVADHDTCTDMGWQKWTDSTKLPTAAGSYYLATDVTITSDAVFNLYETVNLCLNGHTVKTSPTKTAYVVRGGTLNICDCDPEQKGTVECRNSDSAGSSAFAYLYNTATNATDSCLNLYSGTLKGTSANQIGGSIIRLSNVPMASSDRKGIFRMYGGKITGGNGKDGGGVIAENYGDVYLYGGEITGNTGGGLVLKSSNVTLYLAGKVKITDNVTSTGNACNLNITTSAPAVDVTGMHTASRVGITMATPGKFADTTVENLKNAFGSDNTAYKVDFDSNALSLVDAIPPHKHCVCGGVGAVGDHTTCTDVTWTAWTSTTTLPTSTGNYYLTADVTMINTSALEIKVNNQVSLCLNGHTVKSSESVRPYTLRGTLNICDCDAEQKGTIECRVTSGACSGVYMYNSANTADSNFNLYSGTLKGTSATAITGPIVRISNTAKASSAYTATFRMYGGKITGGNSTTASGVMVEHAGSAYLYGGEITGNTGLGGVYLSSADGTVYLAGKVKITDNVNASGSAMNLRYGGGTLDVTGMDKTSQVGITMATPGKFADTTVEDLRKAFTSDNADYTVKFANDELSLQKLHKHCICGGVGAVGDHTTCTDVKWTAWTSTTTLPTATGNYYLTADVTLTATADLGNTAEVNLCLNGHTVHSAATKRPYTVRGKLNLCDCQGTGIVECNNSDSTATCSGVYVYNNNASSKATFNMFGGTLKGTYTDNTIKGPIVRVANNSNVVAHFHMYGGTITGGNCAATGTLASAVLADNAKSEVSLYGGTITGNKGPNAVVSSATGVPLLISGKVNITGNTTVSGTVRNLCLDKFVLSVDGMDKTSRVGITMTTPGKFADTTVEDLKNAFASDNAAYQVAFESNTLVLKSAPTLLSRFRSFLRMLTVWL